MALSAGGVSGGTGEPAGEKLQIQREVHSERLRSVNCKALKPVMASPGVAARLRRVQGGSSGHVLQSGTWRSMKNVILELNHGRFGELVT